MQWVWVNDTIESYVQVLVGGANGGPSEVKRETEEPGRGYGDWIRLEGL